MKRTFLALSIAVLISACGGSDRTANDNTSQASSSTAQQVQSHSAPIAAARTDLDTAALRKKILAGVNSNGVIFNDRLAADERLTSIQLCAGNYVHSVQLATNQRVFPKRGGDLGTCQTYDLAADETVTRVFGGAGSVIDRMGFVTSAGRILGPLGGPGGRPYSMSIANGPGMKFRGLAGATDLFNNMRVLGQINLIGDMTGGDGGVAFIDRMQFDERVIDVVICYRPDAFVQSVQLRTTQGWRPKHGTDWPGLPCSTTRLADTEFITELFGAAGDYVNSLGFATSTGRAIGPFGGPGGTGFSQTVALNQRFVGWYGRSGSWIDKIGMMTPAAGDFGHFSFVDQLPAGARINAVEVCVADDLGARVVRSVQAIQTNGRRLTVGGGPSQTGINTVCQFVNFGDYEYITEMFGSVGAAIYNVGFRTNLGREIAPIGGVGGTPFLLRNPTATEFRGFAGRAADGSYLASLDFAAADVFPPPVAADAQAAELGWWGEAVPWPLVAIHASALSDGRVMTYGTDASGTQGARMIYDIWTPSLGTGLDAHLTLDNTTGTDTFCSAQTLMSNGQLFLTGGDNRAASVAGGYFGFNRGVVQTTLFSPATNTMAPASQMTFSRWYPTTTTLPSGRLLITGGVDSNGFYVPEPELYTPGQGWKRLTGAASQAALSHNYPRVFVSPRVGASDEVFVVAPDTNQIYRLNVDANGGLGTIVNTGVTLPATHSWQRASAMFAPGRVLMQLDSGNTVELQLPTSVNGVPLVVPAGTLSQRRLWSNFVNLPTGEVLALGGSSEDNQLVNLAYHGEIWSPISRTWRTVASEMRPRLYHSTATLLADGRVLSAGGGSPGPLLNINAQTYSPPYLFAAAGPGTLASRPILTNAPANVSVGVGGSFSVQTPQPTTISRVTLNRLGSSTHAVDFDTRFIPLTITTRSATSVTVKAPANKAEAPPGRYWLTVIDNNGVPSLSRVIAVY